MAEILIAIEVAYANPEQQVLIALNLPKGATAWKFTGLCGMTLKKPDGSGRQSDKPDCSIVLPGRVCKYLPDISAKLLN